MYWKKWRAMTPVLRFERSHIGYWWTDFEWVLSWWSVQLVPTSWKVEFGVSDNTGNNFFSVGMDFGLCAHVAGNDCACTELPPIPMPLSGHFRHCTAESTNRHQWVRVINFEFAASAAWSRSLGRAPEVSILNNGPGRNLNGPGCFTISLVISEGIIIMSFMDAMLMHAKCFHSQ
jgi:hypothetical protein